jgi:hypothetical protein
MTKPTRQPNGKFAPKPKGPSVSDMIDHVAGIFHAHLDDEAKMRRDGFTNTESRLRRIEEHLEQLQASLDIHYHKVCGIRSSKRKHAMADGRESTIG